MPNPRLIRVADLKREISASRSTIYRWVSAGIWPRPVRIGPNTAAWLADEVSAVLRARAAGADDDAVRELVARLHAARQQASAA